MEIIKFFFTDLKHFLSLLLLIFVILNGIESIVSAKNNRK